MSGSNASGGAVCSQSPTAFISSTTLHSSTGPPVSALSGIAAMSNLIGSSPSPSPGSPSPGSPSPGSPSPLVLEVSSPSPSPTVERLVAVPSWLEPPPQASADMDTSTMNGTKIEERMQAPLASYPGKEVFRTRRRFRRLAPQPRHDGALDIANGLGPRGRQLGHHDRPP